MFSQITISSEQILKVHFKSNYPRAKRDNTHSFSVFIHPVMNKKTKHFTIPQSMHIDEILSTYHCHSEAKDFQFGF